jgi:NADPH:quinone reductase-like Zn-dependent oxidoreductase
MRGQGAWLAPSGRLVASDAAGEVAAVGPDVERVRVADRILSTILPRWIDGPLTASKLVGSLGGASADGVLAEWVMLDAESVVKVPSYLSDVEAATLPCAALTARHALTKAESLNSSSTLLTQVTGAVSLFAFQFAKAAGARVFATSSSDEKLSRLTNLGAANTLNYRTTPDWDSTVRHLTQGDGVDHTIDIGGAATLQRSIAAVRFEGTLSIVGLTTGLNAQVDLYPIFVKNLRIHGVETGSRTMLESMMRWMAEKAIRPVIDSVFPLEEVKAAYGHLASGQHFGKVCIAL